jgi:predicted metal-dependent peptidase
MDTRPRLVVGLDTSSSIDAQTLRLFTAEAEGIARRSGAEVHLLAFDQAVFRQARLDPAGWQGLRDPQLRSGGGTDYGDLFDKTEKISPSLAVILTDLDAPLPAAPSFPLLWAVPRAVEPPAFGRVLVVGDG